jgi:hypothetical protein
MSGVKRALESMTEAARVKRLYRKHHNPEEYQVCNICGSEDQIEYDHDRQEYLCYKCSNWVHSKTFLNGKRQGD